MLVGLLLALILKGESDSERLDHYVAAQERAGLQVAANIRVNFTGADPTQILVFRDRYKVLSDKLVVFDHQGGQLHAAFCFEPVPATLDRVSRDAPSCSFQRGLYTAYHSSSPFVGIRGPSSADLESQLMGVGDLSMPDQRYDIKYEATADILSHGDPNVLFVLSGADDYARYPIFLSHELATGYRITAPLTEPLKLVAPPHATSEDRELIAHMNKLPAAQFTDATGFTGRFREGGAGGFALEEYAGGEFLLAGYVVAQRTEGGLQRTPCEAQRRANSCAEESQGPPAAAVYLLRAWRVSRELGVLTPVPCRGPSTYVRTAPLEEATALQHAWRKFVAAPRQCGQDPRLGWRDALGQPTVTVSSSE